MIFKHLTVNDGLNHPNALTVCQDAEGFMWIGTDAGLQRYDGYNFISYQHDKNNSTSISDDMITVIKQDPFKKRYLWIGTKRGGLDRFDKNNKSFTHVNEYPSGLPNLTDNYITDLLFTPDTCLYIATEEGIEIITDLYQDSLFAEPSQFSNDTKPAIRRVKTICFDPDNKNIIWIGTKSGLIVKNTNNESLIPQVPDQLQSLSDIRHIYFDTSNIFWIATYGQGLLRLDTEKNSVRKYNLQNGLPSNGVRFIFEDNSGQIWIATNSGLVLIDSTGKIARAEHHRSFDSKGLLHKTIYEIYQDQFGVLWICSSLGINMLTPDMRKFTHYYHNPVDKNTINEGTVQNIIEDKYQKNITWIATEKGLCRFDQESQKFTNFIISESQPGLNFIRSLTFGKKNDLWMGTSQGLVKFNTQSFKKTFYFHDKKNKNSLSHSRVRDIFYQRKNGSDILWIGTDYGLNKFDEKRNKFKHFKFDPKDLNSLISDMITKIYADPVLPDNFLWVSTRNGLCLFDTEEESFTRFPYDPSEENGINAQYITNILRDEKNNKLFVSTDGGGLNIYDTKNDRFIYYTAYDGLPSNTIIDLVQDDEGDLWIVTNQGICEVTPLGEEFKLNYSINNSEVYLNSPQCCFKNNKGEIFLGSKDGLTIINSEINEDTIQKVPLYLTALKVLDKEINLHSYLSSGETLELAYDENYLTATFTALDFASSHQYQYSYMMEGIDKDWIDIGNRTEAFFPYLASGSYTLNLRAAGLNGKWFESKQSIRITILPPFWLSWWFRGLLVILLAAGFLIFHLRRINKLAKHRNELQLLVDKLNIEVKQRTKAEQKYQALNIELEDRIKLRTRQLEQTNNELEAFAYSVSHDLKAPLRSIEGFSTALNEDYSEKLDETGKDYLGRMNSSSKKMSTMIDDILKLSRSTRATINKENINISVYISDLFSEIQKNEPTRNCQIKIEPEIFIFADPTLAGIAIQNLIENAWKFTSMQKITRISFGRNPKDDSELYLKDNGVGFDMKYREKLLKPFQRLHSTSEFKGSGIGLATVNRITTRHGGSIRAESQIGKGSTFYFKF